MEIKVPRFKLIGRNSTHRICTVMNSANREGWIQCKTWVYELCYEVEEKDYSFVYEY